MSPGEEKGQGAATFEKFFNRQATREGAEAAPLDGRLSSTTNRHGYVQLNVRVPVDIKRQVLEVRAKRKAGRLPRADLGEIVAEALQAFLADN